MRIERLDLISYGHLHDQTLDLSEPTAGLVVILGPNEAGKSTTMRAIGALFYGIGSRTPDHFGQGRPSLKVGAKLVSSRGATIEVVRQGLNAAPLVDLDGEVVPESRMLEIVGHAERSLFESLYRVDHQELANGSSALLEAEGELGQLIFGASLGSSALTGVLRDLDAQAERLFRPRASTSAVQVALKEYRSLVKDAKAARVRPRMWDELVLRRDGTEQEIASLVGQVSELRRMQSRLDRIKTSLTLLSRRKVLLARIAEIDAFGPVLDGSVAEEIEVLLAAQSGATTRRAGAEDDRKKVADKLAELAVNQDLVTEAQRIGRLVQGADRYRKDRADLPKLRERLRSHVQSIDSLRQRLGISDDHEVAALLSLTEAQQVEIERFAESHAQLQTDLQGATAEVENLSERISGAEEKLGAMTVAPDVTVLVSAIDVAKSTGPIEERLATATATVEQHQKSASAAAARLHLGDQDPSTIEGIPVPARTEVERARDARAKRLRDDEGVSERRRSLDAERRNFVEERNNLEAGLELPDQAALASARSRRGQGWSLIRSVLEGTGASADADEWTQGDSLPDAYEASVVASDEVADRRYDHAEQLTTIARIDLQLGVIDEGFSELDRLESSLNEREAELSKSWNQLWSPVGTMPAHPDDALLWLEDHKELLGILEKEREAAKEVMSLAQQISLLADELDRVLRSLGAEPATSGLSFMLGQAENLHHELIQIREERTAAEQLLESLRSDLPGRQAALRSAQAAVQSWESGWSNAINPLGSEVEISPQAARAKVQLVLGLRAEVGDELETRVRHEDLGVDITAYEEEVGQVLNALAPDLSSGDVADAITTLNERLTIALANAARQDELEEQLLRHDEAASSAQRDQETASRSVAAVFADISLNADVDLREVIEQSKLSAAAVAEIEEIQRTLVEQGDGRTVEMIDAEAADFEMDGDRVDAARREVDDQLSQLEVELGEKQSERGQVLGEIGQVDGSSIAADLDQEGEEALAETAKQAGDYLRLVLAAAVLRRVISSYGAAHQRPILDDATRIFASLTEGAFQELVVDEEGSKQLILAKRQNGELLTTSALSDGTRDQLYLALRLAGVRHQLKRSEEALPLVLDDLLVNFDDERAARALEVLADLGTETQVLMFTHEKSLAALALDTLGPARCSVIELSARDQTSLPAAPPRASEARPRTARTANAEHEANVLDCLRSSGQALGKAEVLQRSGIPEGEWSAVVKSLIDQGRITQEGQKRGAKYSTA